MNKEDRTPWWKKKEYWGLAGIAGAVMTAIPGLQVPGLALLAGVNWAVIYFGVKDGEKTNTPTGITNAINKLMK